MVVMEVSKFSTVQDTFVINQERTPGIEEKVESKPKNDSIALESPTTPKVESPPPQIGTS